MTSTEFSGLRGLVLAGGRSSRMGADKGLIDYHGLAQVDWLAELLREFCGSVHISVSRRQDRSADYPRSADYSRSADYPAGASIVDHQPGLGPAGGLLSAWKAIPDAAWLLVAVDMPGP